MKFLKVFFAALLAVLTANVLTLLVVVMLVVGAAVAVTGYRAAETGSVLRIDFSQGVTDRPDHAVLTRGMEINGSNSLLEVLGAIDHAATDGNIASIYINTSGGGISLAGLEEVRAALVRFREVSGKPVVAWADTWGQGAYYLASVADSVYVHPEGGVEWRGLASRVVFFKGLLDKLGIGVEVLRHGDFKSAVEPFVTDRMSAANRVQMEALVGSVWASVREDVGASRGIDPAELSRWAAELAVGGADDAVRLGLVDSVKYEDEVVRRDDIVELADYIASLKVRPSGAQKIAVVYVDGDIVDGDGDVCRRLAEARDDDKVAGVVVRVNSPGGSALASDLIWREMELLRATKPVVVSMGAVAASGGYYVACPADLILTDRMTITGSIGVFGLLPNVGGALKDKLGVTTDVALSEPYADMGSPMRAMDAAEREYLSRGIERAYRTFVGHVAAGRNISVARADSLAGGRVWSGADAVAVGLADGIGGLHDAIALCAGRAGAADNYRVVELVDEMGALNSLLRSLGSARIEVPYAEIVEKLQHSTVQARLPYEVMIN
jgi:protease-4